MSDYQEKAAHNFLNRLKSTDPAAYNIIMRRVNSQSMGCAGCAMGGLWDDIKSGFNDIVSSGIDIYKNKEVARQQAKMAEEEAKRALAEQQAQIELAILEQQNAIEQQNLMKERQKLSDIIRDIELGSTQKLGLWVAGGLAAFLVYKNMAK